MWSYWFFQNCKCNRLFHSTFVRIKPYAGTLIRHRTFPPETLVCWKCNLMIKNVICKWYDVLIMAAEKLPINCDSLYASIAVIFLCIGNFIGNNEVVQILLRKIIIYGVRFKSDFTNNSANALAPYYPWVICSRNSLQTISSQRTIHFNSEYE